MHIVASLCCVLMEVSAQLELHRARLDLEWCPHETNQQADEFTNEKVDVVTDLRLARKAPPPLIFF